jgi:signal transduction histidine kinase
MSLKALKKTFGFRMMLWYSLIFTISSICVFALAFWYLSSSLAQRDRALTESRVQEYSTLFQKNGLIALKAAVSQEDLFVRVADDQNDTLFEQIPTGLYDEEDNSLEFDREDLQQNTRETPWTVVHADGEDDLLEIATAKLPGGQFLQVGNTNENRQDILEEFLNLFIGALVLLLLIGFAAGAFLTYRLLHPVREVIAATRSIIDTGKMEARVPTTHSSGEIQELVILFNNMLDKIEVLIRGMKGSLDNVAHDLRTPVSRLRIAAEEALQTNAGEFAYRDALADCLEESERVMTMLNTLMDISEAETGAMKLDVKQWNVAALLQNIVDLYAYLAEEKKVNISTSCPDDLTVLVDHNRFQQAVANLLDNAIKYSSPGGEVRIEAYAARDRVAVCVQDQGIGIAADDLEKVWDRLFRGDKSRSQRGLGLGLSFVKAIVQAHSGTVDVTSQPGAGSTFVVTFPNEVDRR